MKKMLKVAAVLAAILMAFTLGACSDGDDGGSGSGGGGGGSGSGKPQGETFKKFDVSKDGDYYVNKAGEISAEEKDGYVFKVDIRLGDKYNPYNCELKEYTGNDSSLSIPEGVTYISGKVFDGCEELKSVTLPKGIRSIYEKAFNECTALTTVEFKGVLHTGYTIDDTYVTLNGYIGDYAFNNCDKLVTVKYAGTKEQWNSIEPSSEYSTAITGNIFYTNEDYFGKRVTVECKDGKLKAGGVNGYFEDAD